MHEHDLQPLEGTSFTECSTCHAIYDGETLIAEALDFSNIDARTYDEYGNEATISQATRGEDGSWDIRTEGGTGFGNGFGVSAGDAGERVFKPGDGVRTITYKMSYIKGIYHRPGNEGRWFCLFHRTDDEQRQRDRDDALRYHRKKAVEFAGKREKLDADYASLPAAFQARIDKYRANNLSFRTDFEGYEMFTCTQAVVFAETAVKVTSPELAEDGRIVIASLTPEQRDKAMKWYEAWAANESYSEQEKLMPGMSDQHSGNTFGMAVRLGAIYLSGRMEGVVQQYGAMAPLVGSEEYGDVPREATPA